jgi:hypothetical protein
MTRPIEQELTALFNDAVTHLEIQPMPVRRSRAAALSRAAAVGLAAAVVAGLVLVSVRLAGDDSQRTLPAGPAGSSAAQSLLAAMERTWAQPLRIETTTTMDDAPSAAGAPDPAPQTTRTVTEIDASRNAVAVWQDVRPTLMTVDGHLYAAITDTDRTMYELPPAARWQELPTGAAPLTKQLLGAGGVGDVAAVRQALDDGRAEVSTDGSGWYVLSMTMQPRQATEDPHWSRGFEERVHVTAAGRVDAFRASYVFDDDGRSMNLTADVEALDRPVRAQTPDPATVVSAEEFQILTSQPTTDGGAYSSECTVTMDPQSPDAHEPFDAEALITPETCTVTSSGTATARMPKKHR